MTQPEPTRRTAGPPRPTLRPTSPATLVVAALIAGALAWFGFGRYYAEIPDLNVATGLALAGLAVVEVFTARSTRARIERRPGSGPLNPLLVARFVVLAKASSLGAAIFAGAYGGVAVWAISERDELRVANGN